MCRKEALLSLKPKNEKKLICFFTNPLDRDCLKATSFTDLIYCSTKHCGVGLGDISHAICMRISSVKPVPWLAVNLHHLFSNGAAFNTQSRSSLTSYAISRSLSQLNHLRYERDIASLVSELRLCVLNATPALLTRCACISHEIYRPALLWGVKMCRNVLQKPTCVTDSSLCSMWDPEHYHDLDHWTGSVQQKPASASACLSGAPPPESAALLPSLWACRQEIQHLKHFILAWCIHLQAFLKSYPSIFIWAALFSSTSLWFFSSRSCALESSCS